MVFVTEFSLSGLEAQSLSWVRWELFVFPEVRDVQPGARPHTVCVVHEGEAQPELWRQALALAGMGATTPAAA